MAKTKRMVSASTLRGKTDKGDSSVSDSVKEMVRINKELQSRISELMAKVTVLTAEVKSMVDLMRAAGFKPEKAMPEMAGMELPEVPEMPELEIPEEPKMKPRTDVVSDIRLLAEQNIELTKTLRALEEQLRKESTKEAIKKALEKSRRK